MPYQNPSSLHSSSPSSVPHSSFRHTALARSYRDSTIWLLGCLVVMLSMSPAQSEGDDEEGFFDGPFSLRSHSLYADSEWMDSGDYRLTQSTLSYKMDFSLMEWTGSMAWNTYDLAFESPDTLTRPVDLEENRLATQINGRSTLHPRFQLLHGAGFFEGFPDFRSVWFDEYFNQLYGDPSLQSIPGFDTYRKADPGGWNALFGFRTEYIPGNGYLEVQGQYLRDRISPGYEIDFGGLIRFRDQLNTSVVSVSTENILNRRLRSRVDYRYIKTSERRGRHFIQGSLNASLGERWVSRQYVGYTEEAPGFRARFAGLGLDYDLNSVLTLSLTGRYYEDTGEIENALMFTSATPGVRTYQAGLGLRYHKPSYAFRLLVSPFYYVDYDRVQSGSAFFSDLYRSRHWILVQAAFEFNGFR